METAIKKAIEGGYENLTVTQYNLFKDGKLHWQIYTSDPLFWQCLGNALGWSNGKIGVCHICGERKAIDCSCSDWEVIDESVYHWHRFIDHLAENKDPEGFFKELLK